MFMYPRIASKLRMERRSKEPSLLHIDRPLHYPCQYLYRGSCPDDHRRPNEQRMQWCVQPLDFQIFLTRLLLTSKRISLNSHIQKSQMRLCLTSLNIPRQNDHSCACAINRQSACVETVYDLSLIHISEPTRLGMISYAVFCLKKKKTRSQRKIDNKIREKNQKKIK